MKKRGFTLIEMVLVVGLLTTLVIGLTAIFRPMIATYQKSALQTDLKDKAQILIEQISKPMQTAKSLVSEKKSITEFKDEYGRNFLVYSIVNGQLQVWDFPGGTPKALYSPDFYNGYKVDIKLSTAIKDYDSDTTTVKIVLIFNKNGEKYRAESAVECMNIDYGRQDFSIVLSEGYLAIER